MLYLDNPLGALVSIAIVLGVIKLWTLWRA